MMKQMFTLQVASYTPIKYVHIGFVFSSFLIQVRNPINFVYIILHMPSTMPLSTCESFQLYYTSRCVVILENDPLAPNPFHLASRVVLHVYIKKTTQKVELQNQRAYCRIGKP